MLNGSLLDNYWCRHVLQNSENSLYTTGWCLDFLHSSEHRLEVDPFFVFRRSVLCWIVRRSKTIDLNTRRRRSSRTFSTRVFLPFRSVSFVFHVIYTILIRILSRAYRITRNAISLFAINIIFRIAVIRTKISCMFPEHHWSPSSIRDDGTRPNCAFEWRLDVFDPTNASTQKHVTNVYYLDGRFIFYS